MFLAFGSNSPDQIFISELKYCYNHINHNSEKNCQGCLWSYLDFHLTFVKQILVGQPQELKSSIGKMSKHNE